MTVDHYFDRIKKEIERAIADTDMTAEELETLKMRIEEELESLDMQIQCIRDEEAGEQ